MTRTAAPTFAESSMLVARREITMRLRSKAFLISTGILLLAVLASIVVGSLASANATEPRVAAVGSATAVVKGVKGLDVREAASVTEATRLVREGRVDAAVVPADRSTSPLGIRVIALDSAPQTVLARLSVTPPVELLAPPKQNPALVYFVALGFGLVFFMSAITFGSTIAQSVVEEKQTRVVEILMSTIPVRTLLAGKVLGNSILAFAQIAVIALLAGTGLLVTGQSSLLGILGPSIIWFVVFFALGFVLLAALFAAAASLVSRQEDVASVTTPVTMLVMIPYFLVIFFNDNPLVLGVMSYVPFSAPVGMPMRIFLGTAEWWEPMLSLVILLLSAALVIVIGSRIYSNSLLRMGGRVKLSDALAKRR
ncbi:MAG: sodium transporter permease [Microbacteriaceae bacterium]|jgi:ABC-2 type transport system permease protein|nr:sodium transporter permease [Microbacteriaceae bacterium]